MEIVRLYYLCILEREMQIIMLRYCVLAAVARVEEHAGQQRGQARARQRGAEQHRRSTRRSTEHSNGIYSRPRGGRKMLGSA